MRTKRTGKIVIENETLDLYNWLRRHKGQIKCLTVAFLPNLSISIGYYTGKGKYIEIKNLDNLLVEYGGVEKILELIAEWGYPVHAVSQKLAEQKLFEGE